MVSKKKSKKMPGTFVRFDAETIAWLKASAKADGDRSVSSFVRKIVGEAKANAEFGRAA